MHPRFVSIFVALTAALAACGDDPGVAKTQDSRDADRGGEIADTSAGGDLPDGASGGSGGVPADAGAELDLSGDASVPCESDEACGELSYCEMGACLPAAPLFVPPADGVFRAGATRFDVAPAYFEPWTDAAGAGCPGNRAGAYDGPLVTPDAAPGPCDDTFEDLDGDGRFDAVWMAGGAVDRPAIGVDEANPPSGRVLCLQRDGQVWLLVTLDVYAIGHHPLRALVRGLQLRLGIPTQQISVHATGVRTGPDAVGMWGPTLALADGALAELHERAGQIPLLSQVPVQTGLDPAWWAEIRRRIAVAAQQAVTNATPVTLRVGRARLPTPAAEPPPEHPPLWETTADELKEHLAEPTPLSHDTRFPVQRDELVRVAAFEAADGAPLAVLAMWGASPVAVAGEARLSADLAGLVRQELEAAFPGALGLWLTGAGSEEVLAAVGAQVPETEPDGQIVPGRLAADPPASLARLLVRGARDALRDAAPEVPTLAVTSRYAWLAITNPRYGLGARLGVVPGLSDWIAGRQITPVWSSGTETPACGALGCLRYRLDRVDLGPVTLLTTPAGLDEAFVQGRPERALVLRDPESRNLLDLDLDAVLDADDPEIVLQPDGRNRTTAVRVEASLNPQRFAAVQGLEGDHIWLAGRTGGGLGSLRPASDAVNVFEGQMAPLAALIEERPDLAALDLCLAGYDCVHTLHLADLVPQVAAELPEVLADLPGGHLLALAEDAGPAEETPWYRVEAPDGTLRAEGPGLALGPGPWAFNLSADFGALGVEPGDALVLGERRLEIARVEPLVLAAHPNAGDQWRGLHARSGGDAVYNTACELLFGGTCPSARPIPPEADPNATLPRQPDEVPPPPAQASASRGP